MASAALYEALRFEDVLADLRETWELAPWRHIGIDPNWRNRIGVRNVVGTGIAGVGFALPSIISSFGPKRRKAKLVKHRKRDYDEEMAKFTRMYKRKPGSRYSRAGAQKYARKKAVYNKRLANYHRHVNHTQANPTTLPSTGTPNYGTRYKIIKRCMFGPTPTTQESGGTLTQFISNAGSKTTPNGDFAFSYHFKLSDLHNHTEFTSMYQWYKILWVKLHFMPRQETYPSVNAAHANDSFDGTGPSISQAPLMVLASDKTDESLFTSFDDACAHEGAKVHMFNSGNELTTWLVPKPTGLLGTAGSEVVFQQPSPKWITTDNATVPHYGVKAFVQGMSDHNVIMVLLEMKVAFKDLKA